MTEFTWKKTENTNPTKTFARKRIKKPIITEKISEKLPKSIETNTSKLTKKLPTPALKTNETSKTNEEKHTNTKEPNNTTTSTFIKRKQKKEKKLQQQNVPGVGEFHSKNNQKSGHALFPAREKPIFVDKNRRGKSLVEPVFNEKKVLDFEGLDFHRHLVSNLVKNGFEKPTMVQEKAIPVIKNGDDCLIRSQTGSGKSLTYLLPILDHLIKLEIRLQRTDGIQALIIVPTRELVLQTVDLCNKINTFQWIIVSHLSGGESRHKEKMRLKKGVHLLISTPGRLLDHFLHTTNLANAKPPRFLVLDEADRLLNEPQFVKDVEKLCRILENNRYDPMDALKQQSSTKMVVDSGKNTQNILLSATLKQNLNFEFLKPDFKYIDVLEDHSTINKKSASDAVSNMSLDKFLVMPESLEQRFVLSPAKHKLFILVAAILDLVKNHDQFRCFLFMATSQMVEFYCALFTEIAKSGFFGENYNQIDSDDDDEDDDDDGIGENLSFFGLHGGMVQGERRQIFKEFRGATRGVLICTDVVGRGIDVTHADHVIQFTGPQTIEDYLHRVGRTGRAGKSGNALIFLTNDEQTFITNLQEKKIFLKERKIDDFYRIICEKMMENNGEMAASALQKVFEECVENDANLRKKAMLAYTSWSRFYNTYSGEMLSIFNYKVCNTGHYVTCFALRNETPSTVARHLKNTLYNKTAKSKEKTEKRLNQKLDNRAGDEDENGERKKLNFVGKKRGASLHTLTTSEFSSGLPNKKRKKTIFPS